jgi:hypothetical protein
MKNPIRLLEQQLLTLINETEALIAEAGGTVTYTDSKGKSHTISIKTGLSYAKEHPGYKAAEQARKTQTTAISRAAAGKNAVGRGQKKNVRATGIAALTKHHDAAKKTAGAADKKERQAKKAGYRAQQVSNKRAEYDYDQRVAHGNPIGE